jgi:hypothetical protein
MHGLTHVRGGPDPIPGLLPPPAGSFTDWVLALPGVWAYWPLQDASGDAVDYGPSHADLQPVGTPAYHAAGPNSSDLAYAVELTGTVQTSITDDSFVDSADVLDLADLDSASASLTVLCWIRPLPGSDPDATLPIIGTWDTHRTGWVLYLGATTRQLTWNQGNGSASDFLLGPPLANDTWTLVAATRAASTSEVVLYVNGSEVASDILSSFDAGAALGGIRLGAVDLDNTDPDAYHFYGDMAGAVYVDSALTGGQMLEAYNAFNAGGDGDAGSVLTLDENGRPVWAQPTVEVVHGGGEPDSTPTTGDASGYAGGATSPSGWHLDAHTETVVLYDANPARFDVPPRKWVRVPFDTVRIYRSWEPVVDGPDTKEAWLPDDRGLTAQAKQGILHVTAAMAGDQAVSAWCSIEWPVIDYTKVPDDDPEPTHDDAYVRALRIIDISHGHILRASPGSSLRRFFEWPINQPADGTADWVDYTSDNPYPIYPVWPGRPLTLSPPYPQLSESMSGVYYAPRKLLQMTATLAAGDNLCLQAWQDTQWTLRLSTDTFRDAVPLVPAYLRRPYLTVSFDYDPETIDHATGKLL